MFTAIVELIALILVASVWGSMLFFGAVVAPAVFGFLEPEVAGPFIRRLFPRYYLVLGIACIAAAFILLFALPEQTLALILLVLVAIGFAIARQYMMPRINTLRDAALAGDASADQQFQRWHQASVVLNGLQMLVVLFVLGLMGFN